MTMPLTITVNNPTVAYLHSVLLTNIFLISGGTALAYQIWYSDPEAGFPALGGVTGPIDPIADDAAVWDASLTNVSYTGGAQGAVAAGTDKIWLKAYDGSTWTDWAEADITDLGEAAPVVTAANRTVAALGAGLTLNNVFFVSGTGVSAYQIWYSDPEAGAPALGTLDLSSLPPLTLTPLVPDQSVWLPAQSHTYGLTLDALTYYGNIASGTDKIWLKAYNGVWSNWVEADITDLGYGPPTITAIPETVLSGQNLALSSIFNVTSSPVAAYQYQIWFGYPEGGSPALGSVSVNGALIPQDQAVSLGSLSNVVFTGAATAGIDRLWLKAYNGNWSNWVEADINDAVALPPTSPPASPVPPPTVTGSSRIISWGQNVPLTSIFSVSGSGVSAYQIWFSDPEAGAPAVGQVWLNSLPIAQDQAVWLASLSNLTYEGEAAIGTDKLWLKAYNGSWSDWAQADITDLGKAQLVITPNNQTAGQGAIPLETIFSVPGTGVSAYQIWFGDPEGGSPALGNVMMIGATPIAQDQAVTVTDLSNILYFGGTASGTDKIWLRAYNGAWTNWVEADITDPGLPPPTIAATNQTALSGQNIPLTSIFSVTSHNAQEYQLWFSDPEAGSPALGTMAVNGAPLPQDQAVSIANLSDVTYTGGVTAGIDKIWLKAFDGVWSNWVEADITDVAPAAPPSAAAPPTFNTALLNQYAAAAFPAPGSGSAAVTISSTTSSDTPAALAAAHQ